MGRNSNNNTWNNTNNTWNNWNTNNTNTANWNNNNYNVPDDVIESAVANLRNNNAPAGQGRTGQGLLKLLQNAK